MAVIASFWTKTTTMTKQNEPNLDVLENNTCHVWKEKPVNENIFPRLKIFKFIKQGQMK